VVWTKWGDRQSPKISQRKTEDSGVLRYDAVSMGQFPEMFKGR